MGRTFLDASAQSTCASPINNSQTTVQLASTANFGTPSASQPTSAIIYDSGNPAYVAGASPFTVNNEYVLITNNNMGTNTLTFTRTYAGTTPKAYLAGATVAAVWLAEDINSSIPQKFASVATTSGSSITQPVPAGFSSIELVLDIATAAGSVFVKHQLNSDGGAHYYWVQDNPAGDGSRSGSGGFADTSGVIGFVSTGSFSTQGRVRIYGVSQATRNVRWNFEGQANDSGSTVAVLHAIRGGGMWIPASLAALTSITVLLASSAFVSGQVDFYGYP